MVGLSSSSRGKPGFDWKLKKFRDKLKYGCNWRFLAAPLSSKSSSVPREKVQYDMSTSDNIASESLAFEELPNDHPEMELGPDRHRCWLLQAKDRDPAAGKWIALSHTYKEVEEGMLMHLREVNTLGPRGLSAAVESWKVKSLSDLKKQVETGTSLADLLFVYLDAFSEIFFADSMGQDMCELNWGGWQEGSYGWSIDMRHEDWESALDLFHEQKEDSPSDNNNGKKDNDCEHSDGRKYDDGGDTENGNDDAVNVDGKFDNKWNKFDKIKSDRAYTRDDMKSIIVIMQRPDIEDKAERLRHYLGVLLHEMIHGLLNIYTCFCPRCTRNLEATCGHTGHGVPWCKIAKGVEETLALMLGLDLDLGRHYSLEFEIKTSGLAAADVTSLYLNDLGINPVWIEDDSERG